MVTKTELHMVPSEINGCSFYSVLEGKVFSLEFKLSDPNLVGMFEW